METIYDDDNFHLLLGTVVDGELKGRGHLPRDYSHVPCGSLGFAAAFALPIIPRSQWSGIIKQMESEQSRLSDIVRSAEMKSLDQGQTNFCWANGPVNCVRIVRAVNNQPYVDLSPASVACPINGFRNEGGWGTEALARIVSHGVTAVSLWPANAINRSYFTQEAKDNALLHRVSEWWDLQPRNFDQLATCLLNRVPVAVGYNDWSHEVTALDLVETSPGKFGVRIYNSWGDSWEDRGMAILSESKATPDDAVAPRVVNASVN